MSIQWEGRGCGDPRCACAGDERTRAPIGVSVIPVAGSLAAARTQEVDPATREWVLNQGGVTPVKTIATCSQATLPDGG